MFESVIVIGIVLLAAGGVGFGLYRSAAGKGECPGCRGCSKEKETCSPKQAKQN
ncbi:MAG: FeoB-associated Cys-rich membrane protein [Planctomycetaceae bacterium]|nr:MAG: FeoB-associated Cys-rich membrane protein [Planctomycetaceae bacterium]